jgi:hypothetical protein
MYSCTHLFLNGKHVCTSVHLYSITGVNRNNSKSYRKKGIYLFVQQCCLKIYTGDKYSSCRYHITCYHLISYNVLAVTCECCLAVAKYILYDPTLHTSSWQKPAKWSRSKKGKNRITGQYLEMPSLLEQRCTGTTAGLGYLEVIWNCPCNSSLWAIG